MKKLKANTILSAFIFGVSILLLCSFGTDTAYIILSRYKLQKIADAAALEYAASLGRNATYDEGSESNCGAVKDKLQRIYNSIGSGTLAFRLVVMGEKTNTVNKESVVKVGVTSKVMPAFLRFVGAREIILHANSYAKTNVIELEETMDTIELPEEWADVDKVTRVSWSAPFIEGTKRAGEVTAKADFNGDFAIDLRYQMSGGSAPEAGGGFFVFAGYRTNEGTRWVDVGKKVKKENPHDPDPYNQICSGGACFTCVNASTPSFEPRIMTFELQQQDADPPLGNITRFTELRVYKAGGIAGTTLQDGRQITNPCDPSILEALPPVASLPTKGFLNPIRLVSDFINKTISAFKAEIAGTDDGGLPSIGDDTDDGGDGTSSSGSGDPSSTGGGDPSSTGSSGGSDPSSSGGGSSSSSGGDPSSTSGGGDPSSTGGGLPALGDDTDDEGEGEPVISPNVFNTTANVRFIILNNVSLISSKKYKDFESDTGEGACPVPME